jgi:hypothetical protein
MGIGVLRHHAFYFLGRIMLTVLKDLAIIILVAFALGAILALNIEACTKVYVNHEEK